MSQLPVFAAAGGQPIPLPSAPRLESWMSKGHPDQVRLQAYLDETLRAAAERLDHVNDPLAMSLVVGLPASTTLLGQHDLDNYLFPLVKRIGKQGRQVVSVRGTKRIAPDSYLSVDTAARIEDAGVGELCRVIVTASSESTAYKEQVHAAVADLDVLPDGPLALELSYLVGPTRNWINLWKPSIDSLAPLLGSAGSRPWNPLDGRIVELALHCAIDATAGNTVTIGIRAAPIDAGTGASAHGRIPVPSGDNEFEAIEFALSYNAYKVHGDDDTAATAAMVRAGWERDGLLSDDVSTLRTALFLEQRRHRHTEDPRPFTDVPFVAALFERIRVAAPAGVERVGQPF